MEMYIHSFIYVHAFTYAIRVSSAEPRQLCVVSRRVENLKK